MTGQTSNVKLNTRRQVRRCQVQIMFFASTGGNTRLGLIGKRSQSVQHYLVGADVSIVTTYSEPSVASKGDLVPECRPTTLPNNRLARSSRVYPDRRRRSSPNCLQNRVCGKVAGRRTQPIEGARLNPRHSRLARPRTGLQCRIFRPNANLPN